METLLNLADHIKLEGSRIDRLQACDVNTTREDGSVKPINAFDCTCCHCCDTVYSARPTEGPVAAYSRN